MHYASTNTTELEKRKALLTPRERECYNHMCDGRKTRFIAEAMGIRPLSAKTVRKHVRRKLGFLSP